MNANVVDPLLVLVLLLNFLCLSTGRLRPFVFAVAVQGVLLGLIYPLAHQGGHGDEASPDAIERWAALARTLALAGVMILVKGLIIPQLLFKAMHRADVRPQVESIVGFVPSLLAGAVGTALALVFARTLPLAEEHKGNWAVGASLATVLTGFVLLTTRRQALAQILGYLVLENGIFIFGLLLIQAMPILVEVGVLLDLFVGVFVMGIILHHVSRQFPSASSEHLTALRE